jgi:hypothetical protein
MLDLTKNRYSSQWRAENAEELWKMTKAEYEAKHGKPKTKGPGATTGTGGFSSHKSAVEIALVRGLPVPDRVVDDYPDLKREYKK